VTGGGFPLPFPCHFFCDFLGALYHSITLSTDLCGGQWGACNEPPASRADCRRETDSFSHYDLARSHANNG